MKPDSKNALFRVDMTEPSASSDCFDGIVAFLAAIDTMREKTDIASMPEMMVAATQAAFESLAESDRSGLVLVAAEAQDHLYRQIMQLTIMDEYTRTYCATAVRCFFDELKTRGIRTLFILDNELREDRFRCVVELFQTCGIAVTTPRLDGTTLPKLTEKLSLSLEHVGHAAYIEPDASVNHLDSVKKFAEGVSCVATFRNLAPDDPTHEVVRLQN